MIDNCECKWTCHICNKLRPDNNIDVYVKPLFYEGIEIGNQNIRHCNDNKKCINNAETFSFIDGEE